LLRTMGQGQGRAQRGTSHLMAFGHRHSDEIKKCDTSRSWRKEKVHMQLWTLTTTGRSHLGGTGINGRIILKWKIRQYGVKMRLDSFSYEQGQTAWFCGDGNEPLR